MGLLSPVGISARTAPQGNENGWSLEFTKSVSEKHDKTANVDAVSSAAKIEIGDFVINTIERTATVKART